MENKIVGFCEGCFAEDVILSPGFYIGVRLCEDCEHIFDDKTGYCSLSCSLSGSCDESC